MALASYLLPARAGMTDGCITAILWASGSGEGSGDTAFQGVMKGGWWATDFRWKGVG